MCDVTDRSKEDHSLDKKARELTDAVKSGWERVKAERESASRRVEEGSGSLSATS